MASKHSIRTSRFDRYGAKGFTLVELLVVIAIIALLLAMLMPALNKVRESARSIICSTHLRNIGMATQVYTIDNKGYLPPASDVLSYNTNFEAYRWNNAIVRYLSQKFAGDQITAVGTFICPTRNAKIKDVHLSTATAAATKGGLTVCDYGASYCGYDGLFRYINVATDKCLQVAMVKNPGNVYMIMDSDPVNKVSMDLVYAPYGHSSPRGSAWLYDQDNLNKDGKPGKDGINETYSKCTAPYNYAAPVRHNNAMNVVFVDNHVEKVKVMEFLKNASHWIW